MALSSIAPPVCLQPPAGKGQLGNQKFLDYCPGEKWENSRGGDRTFFLVRTAISLARGGFLLSYCPWVDIFWWKPARDLLCTFVNMIITKKITNLSEYLQWVYSSQLWAQYQSWKQLNVHKFNASPKQLHNIISYHGIFWVIFNGLFKF